MAATGRGGCVSLRAERSVWRKGGPGPNPGVVFGSFGLATGERAVNGVIQEFVLPRFTSRGRSAEE